MTENNKKWQEKTGKMPKNDEKNAQNAENDVKNQESAEENEQNDKNLSETEILQQKLLKSEEKASQLNDKLLRALAEIENVRRRSREDLEKANNYAISGFVSELVLVAENFFLACNNMPKEEMESSDKVKNFALGVDMTKKELMKILEKNKVKRIFPLNEQFNHDFHEAISQVESDEDEGVVVNVIQAGYSLGDRLLKPALVTVSKGK